MTLAGFPFAFWIGLIKKNRNRKLYREFHFNQWHTFPVNHRLYALKIMQYLNRHTTNSDVIVEVGCGLAEILGGVRKGLKIGYDIEPNVIRAAQFLHKNRRDIKLEIGSFEQVHSDDAISFLVTVNFIHEIAPDALEKMYLHIFNKFQVKILIAEEVKGHDYKYHHNISKLIPAYFVLEQTIKVSDSRRVLVYRHA